jgi:tetratricopeptide (TPR) repeat protein
MLYLAQLHIDQERYDDAEKLLLKAVDVSYVKLGDTHPHTLKILNNLIALYESWNKPEEAEKWRAKLPQRDSVVE